MPVTKDTENLQQDIAALTTALHGDDRGAAQVVLAPYFEHLDPQQSAALEALVLELGKKLADAHDTIAYTCGLSFEAFESSSQYT